jgi:hypothetical protein
MQFVPDGTPQQHQWFNDLARYSTSCGERVRMMRVFGSIDVGSNAPQGRLPGAACCMPPAMRACRSGGPTRRQSPSPYAARFVPLESRNHLLLHDEPAWRPLDGRGPRLPASGTAAGGCICRT